MAVDKKPGRQFILRGTWMSKFYGNAANSFQDILLKTTNVNLKVDLKEKSGDH